jgi:hypothetical protein
MWSATSCCTGPRRVAKENERFYYWFELLNWEKMLLEEAYESGEFTKDLDALIEEERDVIEKLGTSRPTTSCTARSTMCSAAVGMCAPMRSMRWWRRSASIR